MGIPDVLEYPHGCFEQKSARMLVYTALGRVLGYLPADPARDANYRRTIESALGEFETSLLPDGLLPYWPQGMDGNPYVTIQAAWAVAWAQDGGFKIPERLSDELPGTLRDMVLRKSRVTLQPTLRAFALFVLWQMGTEADGELTAAAEELVLHRDRLTDEGKAMLAIALYSLGILPDRQTELVKELPATIRAAEFNPVTFSSTTRTEALCIWARLLVDPKSDQAELKRRLGKMMESSATLSTQENLWLLVAFNSLLATNPPAKLPAGLSPTPSARASSKSAVAWNAIDLAKLEGFAARGLGKSASGTYVMAARRQLASDEREPVSRGLRLDRVVRDLTDASRDGTASAPFKLGDQILISYRFYSDKPQSFIAVEDPLPAGLEVLNPNLEMFGKTFDIPDEPGISTASLSHAEMRDRQTDLYFDIFPRGGQRYAVLARATAAGSFAWPAAQMAPMYDSRFYARTAPTQCVVVSE